MRTVRLSRKQVCSLTMQCSGYVSISYGSGFADPDPGGHLILDPARSRMHYLWPKLLNSSVKTVTFTFEKLVRFRIRISALQIPIRNQQANEIPCGSSRKKCNCRQQQNEEIERNCQGKDHGISFYKRLTFSLHIRYQTYNFMHHQNKYNL